MSSRRSMTRLVTALAVLFLSGPPAVADPLSEARAERETAENRALAADTAYGEMKIRNYPRGEARRQIVDERVEARAALERARAHFEVLSAESR